MIGLDLEVVCCKGDFGGCRDCNRLCLRSGAISHFLLGFWLQRGFFVPRDEFLFQREFLLWCFLPVFVPRRSAGDLAAQRIRHTFGISDFWRSSCN